MYRSSRNPLTSNMPKTSQYRFIIVTVYTIHGTNIPHVSMTLWVGFACACNLPLSFISYGQLGLDLCMFNLHDVYSETSIYRSRIIHFPGSVVQFLWSLSESYFIYGSRIYCFPGSIVSFSDP
jgi:hypothetical protein